MKNSEVLSNLCSGEFGEGMVCRSSCLSSFIMRGESADFFEFRKQCRPLVCHQQLTTQLSFFSANILIAAARD